nr:uncharacterized protein KIAA1210 homolog [Microcebus murinus]XP_012594853.1 uncharacterized protein KIAA1210 homolog [Microcebus murinus]XP_012594860.1 uncharacterized protein KIAA1210 homolog [Microcebus murinus]
MAEFMNEASGSLEILETSDEGKKKFKFKAFKSFFGKKKKKDPEDAHGGTMLKSSLSTSNLSISSLQPVPEDQQTEPRPKSGMGNKALSHDSIFMLESEPERSTNTMCLSTEHQRGRTLQRSHVSRTLPRTGSNNVHGVVSEAMFRDEPRSEVSTEDSKMTESSEPPSGPDDSQSFTAFAMLASTGSTQLPMGFSTPPTTKGCLDSSAARHKMALNPRKQKKKKNLQGKLKQEESEEEKITTKPKEATRKKLKKSSAGFSSQEQNSKTEIYDKKTTDQALNTNAAARLGYPALASHGRRRRRKGSSTSGTSESGSKGRSFKQSSRGRGLGDRAGYSPTDKTDRNFWHLSLEKQVMEQQTTIQAETTTSQEFLSDKGDTGKRNAGIDFEARKASAQPIPEDGEESMASGPLPCHEEEASGAVKTETRASHLPMVKSLSTTQKESILSVAAEAQMFIDPSHIQLEEKEAFSVCSQNVQSKMESAHSVTTTHKGKLPKNALQAFAASVWGMMGGTSNTAEGGIFAHRLPRKSLAKSLRKPEAEDVPSDSESASEEESGSEEQLAPGHTFQSSWKLEDEEEVFPESEGLAVRLSHFEKQVSPGYSPQSLGKPEAKEVSSDSESSPKEESGSEELAHSHSSHSLEKLEDEQAILSESQKFVMGFNSSEEQLVPRCISQSLQEPEDEEISTESDSYVEKYNSAEDWSSSEEDLPLKHPAQALEKPEDQQEVSSVSKNPSKEGNVSVQQLAPICPSQPTVRLTVQQQVSTSLVSTAAEWSSSAGPMPSRHPFQPWVSPTCEQQVSAGPESAALEWGIYVEPLPPRMSSKRLMRSKVEQKVSTGPEITSIEGAVSMELLSPKCPSQPLVRPMVKQQVSEEAESAAVEGSISMALSPPGHPFQPWVSPKVQQNVSSFPDSMAVEGSISMKPLSPNLLSQPMINPNVQQNMFLGSEGAAGEPLLSKYSTQHFTNPQVQQMSESTAIEEAIFVELLPPGCPSQPLGRSKLQPQVITLNSAGTATGWSGLVEPVPSRHTFQPCVHPTFEQQVPASPESAVAEGSISMEPMSARHPFQPWVIPTFEQHVSAGSENTAVEWGISMDLLPSRMPAQPQARSVVNQPVSAGSVSASAEWSGSMEPMPPGCPFQPWANPKSKQQISAGSESSAAEGSISMESRPPRHHSQPRMRSVFEQEASSGSMSTSTGKSTDPVEPRPSRYAVQPWVNPKFKQQVSAGSENVATEKSISSELPILRRQSRSTVKQKIQQMSSSFNAAGEMTSSGRPLPPKYPTQLLVKSRVQEMSSRLENNTGTEESISKKSQGPRRPSQSFVKFMAQQIFSESPAVEGGNVDPLPQDPFKSSTRPKVEHQVFSEWESADPEGGISVKRLPMKHPLQPAGKSEEPQEGFSYSESAPEKWSDSKKQPPLQQLSQDLGKLEYQREVSSVSDSLSEEGKKFEERMPSRCPSQALDESELQPQVVPMRSANIPIQWSSPAGHLPPSDPFQAFGDPEYQQHIYSSSAPAEGTIFESNADSWSPPRVPAAPNKTKKHSQGSEDLIKSSLTPATKPGKFTTDPAGQTSISGGTYTKEEVLESDGKKNNWHSDLRNEGDVENLFGVRLKRISSSQKYKSEQQDYFTQLPSLPLGPISPYAGREPQIKRSTSQGLLNTAENLTAISDSAEKQNSSSKSEGMAKKKPAYKTSENHPGQPDDAISEPAWITMAMQKQRSFQAHIPMKEPKTKSTAGAKAETKEPKHGGTGPANENQPKMILTADVRKQGKAAEMKLPKSTKSVEFEDQKIPQVPTMGKETKRSSTLPTTFQQLVKLDKSVEPIEPVWFSMAKKKAKAWSHMADIMQ